MKKKNLKLNFNKETVAKLQMNEVKGGATKTCNNTKVCQLTDICVTLASCEPTCTEVTISGLPNC